jgi:hypothetical protein
MVSNLAPGPVIVIPSAIGNSPEVNAMVVEPAETLKMMVSPAFADAMAARRDPVPESLGLVTVMVAALSEPARPNINKAPESAI